MEHYEIGSITQNDDGSFNVGAADKEMIDFLLDQLKTMNHFRKHRTITKRQNGFYTTVTKEEMLAILTTYAYLEDSEED